MAIRTKPSDLTEMERKFWAFHKAHPEVYQLIDFLTRNMIAKGVKHLSMKMLFEIVRYESIMRRGASTTFQLNNSYHAYYARLWLKKNPEHESMFQTRALNSKRPKQIEKPSN